MENKHLIYAKNATKLGFTDAINNFSEVGSLNVVNKKEYVFDKANKCRWWYQPLWKGETKYLPNGSPQPTEDVVNSPNVDVFALTLPPKKQDNTIMNALLIGAGIFIVFKLLS